MKQEDKKRLRKLGLAVEKAIDLAHVYYLYLESDGSAKSEREMNAEQMIEHLLIVAENIKGELS